MKTISYTALSPMRYSGEEIVPGESVQLSEKEAAPLLACGAIRDPSTAAAEQDPAPVVPSREDQIKAVVVAMLTTDPEKANKDMWTKAGKPEVKAIEATLGFDITAAERDTALEAVIGQGG